MDTTGRDLGLRRVSRITRWSVAGAAVLTAAFSALVAHARPGHAKSLSSSSTTTPTTTIAPSPGGSFLQPPPTGAPGRGRDRGVATSGAS